MSARDEILARIRTALADVPDAPAARDVPVPWEYGRPTRGEGVLDLFVERVEDYGAAVVRCRADEVPARIADALAGRGAASVVVPADLDPAWRHAVADAGIEVREDDGLTRADLDATDAVVTACAVAAAESGTIMLDHRGDQGRRALSLVPDLHVCVVRLDQVVSDVPEAVARIAPAVREERRPITWISGGSATSDIELSRVEGVHGPRTLVVVLVEGPSTDLDDSNDPLEPGDGRRLTAREHRTVRAVKGRQMSSTRIDDEPRDNEFEREAELDPTDPRTDAEFDKRADDVERRLDDLKEGDRTHEVRHEEDVERREEPVRHDEDESAPRDEAALQTADGQDDEATDAHTRADDAADDRDHDGDSADDDDTDPEEEAESRRRAEEFAREHDPAKHDIAAGEEFRQRGDIVAEDGRAMAVDREGHLQDAGDAQSLADGTASPDVQAGGGQDQGAQDAAGGGVEAAGSDGSGTAGRRISEFDEIEDGGYGVGSARPIHDGAQPLDHPVKAWNDTRTFVEPGHAHYDDAEPHVWFYDAHAAEAAGFGRAGD